MVSRQCVITAIVFSLIFFTVPAYAAKYELKLQTAVPSSSMYFKTMERLGKNIEELSQGEIKVSVYADGAIVKAFEIIDAVSDGIVNGGQAWAHYWSGKNPTGLLFSSPTAGLGKGLDQRSLLSWAWEDNGHMYLNRYYQKKLGYDVKAWLVMPMGPEPFGWFPKQVKDMEELRAMKFRSPPGIPAETFNSIKMPVVSMPGSEIVPSAQRKVIDAAEWISPADDIFLGLADVWKYYYLEGLHQALSIGDVYINKTWYESLPKHLQKVIDISMKACVADQITMNISYNSKALKQLVTEKGVILADTPGGYYHEYMTAVPKTLEKYAQKDPFFKEVLDSLNSWADLTVPYAFRVNGVYYKIGKTALDSGATTTYK